MKQHLRDLLSNNVPPSEDILREVEEILVIPRQKLFETESEIRKLKNQLKFLESKREDIQKSIDEYRPITIPIRRIPPDVLAEIFYHCLPSHRNPILSESEAPVLLTRVCSSWRSLALSSPCLWARVHITFNDEYIGPYNIRVFKLRCDVVKDWLTRSGHCPLLISFHHTTRLTGLHYGFI
ncbi:hypothetical protein CPB84DRAFT_1780520 [Gymnopilus junonius]|uniref:F-box domain-containing protein n=1 Tax=Gymnopilus junonius TaxID=109634 RepID=A0A9P5NNC9_GYMJU|nr:hypothetical protein CPB84DRAFT_1780520 [Gymnopilus junonius]